MAEPNEEVHKEVAHEGRDVNIRGVLIFAAALAVSSALILLVLWGLFHYFDRRMADVRPYAPPLARERQRVPPEPRLQGSPVHPIAPLEEMAQFRQKEEELLRSYGWVDPAAGIVRIPIDEAKKLLLRRQQSAGGRQ